jgi:hypothetical protein
MGMSTYVNYYRPPDEKFEKMKAAYNACKNAGLDTPDEVSDFFQGQNPNLLNGVEIQAPSNSYVEGSDDSRQYIEVDLTKLPKDVRFVRFVNSW